MYGMHNYIYFIMDGLLLVCVVQNDFATVIPNSASYVLFISAVTYYLESNYYLFTGMAWYGICVFTSLIVGISIYNLNPHSYLRS